MLLPRRARRHEWRPLVQSIHPVHRFVFFVRWSAQLRSGNVDAVKMLVNAGVDVVAKDGKGQTVGMILDSAGSNEIVDRLMDALAAQGKTA
mmetsp:Transcript_30463/g.81205  ORF Transcript_30463/g.81205 Transcript_30463/m.81205 type:complete len:91 (-) Transcript_30463:158-430(-)